MRCKSETSCEITPIPYKRKTRDANRGQALQRHICSAHTTQRHMHRVYRTRSYEDNTKDENFLHRQQLVASHSVTSVLSHYITL